MPSLSDTCVADYIKFDMVVEYSNGQIAYGYHHC